MRYRKFTAYDRDNPIFELLDGETILLDISINNEGILEIAFHEGIASRIIPIEEFRELLDEGAKEAWTEPQR
jgi:hypothetical protein